MILYYLKETFRSLLQSKLATMLILITTTIAIMFVIASISLVIFSNTINTKLKENIQISLFVSDTVSQSGYDKISSILKENVFVQNFEFVTKKQALERMKRKTGTDFSAVLDANPLPAKFDVKLIPDSVSTSSISPIVDELKNISGIDDVVYDYSLTLKVLNFINNSKKIIYGVSIFLVLLSIYLVYSNNKLVISSRINEYNTMKLVGAKLRTIKIPIFLNGIVIGAFSSILALGITYFIYQLSLRFYSFQIITEELYYILGIVLAVGLTLGFLGSFLSTLNVSLKVSKIK